MTVPIDRLAPLNGLTVLITGADGMLGRAFDEALAPLHEHVAVIAHSKETLDVTDTDAVLALRERRPDLILHCAALSIADECERQPDAAREVHVGGTQNVCRLARECGARIFYPQSFLIFDGSVSPVTESTVPAPWHVYGRLKLEAEQQILAEVPGSLVTRLSGFFGGDEKDKNFVGKFVRQVKHLIADGHQSIDVGDRVWQPTYTLDIARNSLLLLALGRSGTYNMGCVGEASFFDVAEATIQDLGLQSSFKALPVSSEKFDRVEAVRRPKRVVMTNQRLGNEGLDYQRHWRNALHEYLQRPYFDQFRTASRIHV